MPDRHDRPADLPADRPDPAADTWSAWLPRLDATADVTSDTTGAARPDPLSDPTGGRTQATPPVAPGPPLPQSAGPAVPPASVSAQQSYPQQSYPQPTTPAAAVEPMPRTHMALAIISLFMGLPIVSIVAIIAAASVKSRWRKGNVIGAEHASRAALVLSIAAIVLKVVWGVVQNNVSGVNG